MNLTVIYSFRVMISSVSRYNMLSILLIFIFIACRDCLKAYHPSCVNEDDSLLETGVKWKCGKLFLFVMTLFLFIIL